MDWMDDPVIVNLSAGVLMTLTLFLCNSFDVKTFQIFVAVGEGAFFAYLKCCTGAGAVPARAAC